VKIAFSKSTKSDAEAAVVFREFRRVGYEGLQLKGNQYGPFLADPARFRAAWGGVPGVASALITGGTLDGPGAAALRRVFAFGEAVGSELIVFCHGVPRGGLTADDIRGFATALSDLGREARDHGLKLSLHHHHNNPVMHREDFGVFFDAVADGAVGLTVDTAHLAKSGVDDIAGLIREMSGVVDNFHLKDFADGAWRVLGTGSIDFAPIFAAIREIGYDGWLSADEESGAEPSEAMAQCLRFIRAGLGGS